MGEVHAQDQFIKIQAEQEHYFSHDEQTLQENMLLDPVEQEYF